MKIAFIGYGARGALYSNLYADKAEIVAICDTRLDKLELAKKTHNLQDCQLFCSEDDFFEEKRGDLCVISSPDGSHKKHALEAIKLGYDIQLEKPIACTNEDCEVILQAANEAKCKVFVCHVLRYSKLFSEIKKELDSGVYGKVVTINLTENIGYWHFTHSYVRGNWRNSETASPSIVAKCCHDLDLLCWYMGKECISVSSMGELSLFKAENAPPNSAERCLGCSLQSECEHDAEQFYVGQVKKGKVTWPINVLHDNPTEQTISSALQDGNYGRCVYRCDNNVVDHQIVNILFEGGVTAHLTMSAFTKDCFRKIHIFCEHGEIFNQGSILTCNVFGKDSRVFDVNTMEGDNYGHGGGDVNLVKDILAHYNGGNPKSLTTLQASMQSHRIGFAAEKSRQRGGELIKL